jgi:response regulator of citrate/malate metabolism
MQEPFKQENVELELVRILFLFLLSDIYRVRIYPNSIFMPQDLSEKYNLLILDDDELFLFLTRQSLLNHPLISDITVFHQTKDALEYLKDCHQKPENFPRLIYVDFHLDDAEGLQFARQYNHTYAAGYPETRLFIITSTITEAKRQKALSTPSVKGIVQKPLSIAYMEKELQVGN